MSAIDKAVELLTAAKDIGESKGDRERRKRLLAVVKTAEDICKSSAGEFEDVLAVCGEVAKLVDTVSRLDEAKKTLATAKNGSEEAVQAQKTLDRVRGTVDTLAPALQATLTTLEKVAINAHKAIADASSLKKALAEASAYADSEKLRLKSAIQAVKNSVLVG
jgi:hypothetical protein